jgi:hypothetical protein
LLPNVLYLHFVQFLLAVKINCRRFDGLSNGRHAWQAARVVDPDSIRIQGFDYPKLKKKKYS